MSHLPQDQAVGAYLQALRTAAGLDVAVLARRMSLSSAQLSQLETGQDSLFYNRKIREQAARKVILHLGGDPSRVLGQPATQAMAPADPPEAAPAVGAVPATPQPAKAVSGTAALVWKVGVFLGVLLGGAAYWAGLPFRGGTPGPDVAQDALAQRSVPAPAALSTAEAQGPAPATQALTSTASVPSPAGPAEDAVPVAALHGAQACPETAGAAPAVQPPQARKAGDMVHVVSLADAWVCLTDGSGKQQHKRLEPGQAQSFYGPPPWVVRSDQLRQTQLYFQGWKVRLPEHAHNGIELVELR